MLPIAILVAARFFLPRLRKGNAITAYEFLESRFGSSVRIYGAVSFIVAQFIRLSLILYLVGLVLQQIIGYSANECIILAGIAVALYTVLGGINAVIWTDVIQTTVLLLGGLICMFVIVQSLPGGFSQIIEVGMIHGKLAFAELRDGQLIPVSWGPSLSEKTITMMLLIGLISWLTEYSSNQNTVQRFNAASSAAEARKAMYICAAVSLPTWLSSCFWAPLYTSSLTAFLRHQLLKCLWGSEKQRRSYLILSLNTYPGVLLAWYSLL